jgi:c-di-GMP-related signal transduction protein
MNEQNQDIYIGRQPVLNAKKEIFAYQLLFKSKNTSIHPEDPSYSASKILSGILNNDGIKELLDKKTGFIKIDENLIDKQIIKGLQKDRFILEISENTVLSDSFINSVDSMKKQGFVFAFDDIPFSDKYIEYFKQLYNKIDIAVINTRMNSIDSILSKVKMYKAYNIKLMAENLRNMDEFNFYTKLGFDYFHGYFFIKPVITKTLKIDPNKSAMTKLIGLIQKDSDITNIEETFKLYPDLTINLLEFINSAYVYIKNHISSIRQAITLLGYQKLLNWLILLLYSNADQHHTTNPLLYTASQRGRMMELLIQAQKKEGAQTEMDEAFLIGLLSLLEALFLVPIEQIIGKFNVSKEITDAIVSKKGNYGELLELIEKTEENNIDEIDVLLKKLHLTLQDLNEALLCSFSWISNLQKQ